MQILLLVNDPALTVHDQMNAQVMRRAMSYATSWDLLIVHHAEEPALARGGHMNSGEVASRLGLKGIPPMAEVIMVERDLRLAEMTGARLAWARRQRPVRRPR